MPTKHAILAELTAEGLRASIDFYELAVADRRVKQQLVPCRPYRVARFPDLVL